MIVRVVAIVAAASCLAVAACRTGGPEMPASGEGASQSSSPNVSKRVDSVSVVPPSRRVYSQVNLNNPRAQAVDFVQLDSADGRVAGSLDGVDLPVAQYLDPHSREPDRPRLNWPHVRRAEAFFVEFHPPIEEWPPGSEPTEQQASLVAYEPDGLPFSGGKARRRVWNEGLDAVETAAGKFEGCARVRADSELNFGKWATMRIEETAWISPQAGVVRRIERITGRAILIFRFASAYRYDLKSYDPAPAAKLVGAATQAQPAGPVSNVWARLAIHIQRSASRPRVAGLAIDWGQPSQSDSSR